MAWIEAHQELARHPKVRRLARELDVTRAAAIGHLFMVWWWAVDFAPDGVVDAEDVADAAEWNVAEAEWFAKTLEQAGFLDPVDGGWVIHDWSDYAGKTIDARDAARRNGEYGNHVRWHDKAPKKDCEWCSPRIAPRSAPDIASESHITGHDITNDVAIVENPALRLANEFTGKTAPRDVLEAERVITAHPWVADLDDVELGELIRRARASGTRFLSGLVGVAGELRPKRPLPEWCGGCEEGSRLVSGVLGWSKCPHCHPGSR